MAASPSHGINSVTGEGLAAALAGATQFFEFVGRIADSATDGQSVRLPSALTQPIASDDVAAALASVAPVNVLHGLGNAAGRGN